MKAAEYIYKEHDRQLKEQFVNGINYARNYKKSLLFKGTLVE